MSIPDVKTRPVRPGRTTAARLYQELDGTRAEVTRLQGIIDTMGEQLREATSQAANKPKSDYIKELEAENNALDTKNAALSLMVRDTRRLLPEGKQEGHLPRLVSEGCQGGRGRGHGGYVQIVQEWGQTPEGCLVHHQRTLRSYVLRHVPPRLRRGHTHNAGGGEVKCITCNAPIASGRLCSACINDGHRRLFADVAMWRTNDDSATRLFTALPAVSDRRGSRVEVAAPSERLPRPTEGGGGVRRALRREAIVGGLLAFAVLCVGIGYGLVCADEVRDQQTAARIEVGPGMARQIGGRHGN